MAQLEERIEQLENDLELIKVGIKEVLVELKELVLRDENPLAGQFAVDRRAAQDTPVIIVSS